MYVRCFMLNEELEELKAVNDGEDLKKLADTYDDFAIGVIAVGTQFFVVYDTDAIINNLIEEAGLDVESAEAHFTETIGTNSEVAFLVKTLNDEPPTT